MWLRTIFPTEFRPGRWISGSPFACFSIQMTRPPGKAELRKSALARRAAVPDDQRQAFAERIATEGVELCRRAFVRNVALFWPIGSEPDTTLLLMALAHHELQPCLPVTGARSTALTFRRYRYGEPMQEGPVGTYEPAAGLPQSVPDFTFVPLAAFDRRGYRIGYGGGYYDATLAQLRARHPGPAVGIAFACQEVDRVPEEDHDQPLDLILTENELIDCSLAWR